MGWENGACSQKPISISRPAKSLHVGSGGHNEGAIFRRAEKSLGLIGGGANLIFILHGRLLF